MVMFIEQGKSGPLKACSKFLLNGSLFNFPLILLFGSKTNILKFTARLHKQVERGMLGKGCCCVCVRIHSCPSSKTLSVDLSLINAANPWSGFSG